jgi:ABC-type transport system involved in cytochrome c biogenesis permease subunit
MNIHFFKFASFLYLFGTLAYLAYIIFLKEALSKLAVAVVSVGFASHTLAILTRYVEAGHTPVTHLYESLSFFAWMIIGILLIANLKYKVKVLGSFLTPIALILMFFAFALPKEIFPLAPVLKSFWHPFHVIFAFLGHLHPYLLLWSDVSDSGTPTQIKKNGSHSQETSSFKCLG